MAGDWIKMRIDLASHPKLVRILSATQSDKFRVIGGLHAVWSVFDTHSENGELNGYSLEMMDHIIGWEGFSAAMAAVGWLEETAESLVMPDFIEHNGRSAKRRAEDQKRKRESRKNPQQYGQNADKMRTREEKEKIKEKTKDLSSEAGAPDPPKYSPDDFRFAEGMLKAVLRVAPKTKPPDLARWADTIRLMRERDGLTHSEIADVFRFANQDDFWKTNILSPAKLREQFAKLDAKMRSPYEKRLSASAARWAIDHDDTSWLTGADGPGDCLDGELDIPPDADNLHRLEAGGGGRY